MSIIDKLLVAINFIRCWQQYLIPNIMSIEIENSDKNKGLANALSELGLFVSTVQVPKGSIPYLEVSRYDLTVNDVAVSNP
jgi:hypothetical protein